MQEYSETGDEDSEATSLTETTVNHGKVLTIQKRHEYVAKGGYHSNELEDLLDCWPNFEISKVLTKLLTIFKAIEDLNDNGRYQNGIMWVAIVCLFGCSFTSYILGFTASDPVTECL